MRIYPGSPIYEYYPIVQCDIHLKRKPQYYIVGFCLPSTAITILALLGVKASFVGCSSSSKGPGFQIALMSLMALCVLLLSISAKMPTAETISSMQAFFFGLIFILVASPMFNWSMQHMRDRFRHKKKSVACMKRIDVTANCLLLAGTVTLFIWVSSPLHIAE